MRSKEEMKERREKAGNFICPDCGKDLVIRKGLVITAMGNKMDNQIYRRCVSCSYFCIGFEDYKLTDAELANEPVYFRQ